MSGYRIVSAEHESGALRWTAEVTLANESAPRTERFVLTRDAPGKDTPAFAAARALLVKAKTDADYAAAVRAWMDAVMDEHAARIAAPPAASAIDISGHFP